MKLASADDAVPNIDFALVVRDAAGAELERVLPILRMPASDPQGKGTDPRSRALLQETLPRVPGMASVALLHKDVERDVFRSGYAATSVGAGLSLRGRWLDQKWMSLQESTIQEVPGVTYTVLVKPENAYNWSTVAVGRLTPYVKIDRNQFPGEKRARVQVLRSTGFENAIVFDEDVDVDDET